MLLAMCLGPFLGLAIYLLSTGTLMAAIVALFCLFLFGVFFYKSNFIHVTISEKGVLYKSGFQERLMAWEEVKDVLIVVRERRNVPDYYKFDEWVEANRLGKNYFLLFRTIDEIPENPMFMFSEPMGKTYISVQYRKQIEKDIFKYYYT